VTTLLNRGPRNCPLYCPNVRMPFSRPNMSFVQCSRPFWNAPTSCRSRFVSSRRPGRPLCRKGSVPAMAVSISYSDDLAIKDVGSLGEALREDAENLLSAALNGQDAELSVLLCSDEYILQLNRIWRQVASATDVLSFPQNDPIVRLAIYPFSGENDPRQKLCSGPLEFL
jgi:Endoribonuclease YbeY